MLVTSGILILFSALVVWHDKPVALAKTSSWDQVAETYPAVKDFLNQLSPETGAPAFWSVGVRGAVAWPQDISRACYADPLVAHWKFSKLSELYPGDIEVTRYRSPADFIEVLLARESVQPGYISQLNFTRHTAFPEKRLTLSLGALGSLLVASLGLLVIRRIQGPR